MVLRHVKICCAEHQDHGASGTRGRVGSTRGKSQKTQSGARKRTKLQQEEEDTSSPAWEWKLIAVGRGRGNRAFRDADTGEEYVGADVTKALVDGKSACMPLKVESFGVTKKSLMFCMVLQGRFSLGLTQKECREVRKEHLRRRSLNWNRACDAT